MSKGVEFVPDLGDAMSKDNTMPPNVAQGGSKGIDFPGSLSSDVTHSMESTKAQSVPLTSGKGEFISPVEFGH